MTCCNASAALSGGCGCCRREWGVHFVLALALFPQLGYVRVWDKLTSGLHELLVRSP